MQNRGAGFRVMTKTVVSGYKKIVPQGDDFRVVSSKNGINIPAV